MYDSNSEYHIRELGKADRHQPMVQVIVTAYSKMNKTR